MYANTCWGLVGLAVTFALAVLGLPPDYIWLQPYFIWSAAACGLMSAVLFCWPLLRKIWRFYFGKGTKQDEPHQSSYSRVRATLAGRQEIQRKIFTKLKLEGSLEGVGEFYRSSWTPGRTGNARINASVGWSEHHDEIWISIFKNANRFRSVRASQISVDVPVNSPRDEFSIFVFQDGPGSANIEPHDTITYATFSIGPEP